VKVFLDEHLPRAVAESLRTDGHDVLWASEAGPGLDDPTWLQRALSEDRLVISSDKGFAARAYQSIGGFPPGFILLRTGLAPTDLARHLSILLASGQDFRLKVWSWDGEAPPRSRP
jgi:predicted nuclease of predicted toxin-antitoxin system